MRAGRVKATRVGRHRTRECGLVEADQRQQNPAWKRHWRNAQIPQPRFFRIIVFRMIMFRHATYRLVSKEDALLRRFRQNQPGPSASAPGISYPIRGKGMEAVGRGKPATGVSPGCAARPFRPRGPPPLQPAPVEAHYVLLSTRQAGAHMTFQYAAPAGSRWTGSGETCVSPNYLQQVKERNLRRTSV